MQLFRGLGLDKNKIYNVWLNISKKFIISFNILFIKLEWLYSTIFYIMYIQ
jgi:hypothetical protein